MTSCQRFFLFLALSFLCPSMCRANTLWVVLLPGTSLSDWQNADAPHLHQLLGTGAIGLMNTRTARTPNAQQRETPESAALTLGAGSRAAGGSEATDFSPLNLPLLGNVTAGQMYARRMGIAPPLGSQVNVQWPRVLRENAAQGYDLRPGNLADALGHASVTLKAMGGPLADAVAAHGDGWVIHAPLNLGLSGNQCLVWDAGSDIHTADTVIGMMMAHLRSGRIVVLSPSASNGDYARGAQLCPVAVWGQGILPGVLFSASTRQAGLVTDTDFATTVAAYFGISWSDFPARPFGERAWAYRPLPNAMAQIAALNANTLAQWNGMRVLPYLALFLGFWMVVFTALNAWVFLPRWVISVPPAVILALLLSDSPWMLALWLTVSLACTLFVYPIGYVLALGGLLAGDMLMGDPLMHHGLLGYSAIEGARYYGIGNEAMGPLIGACLILADRLWQTSRPAMRPGIWLTLLGVTVLLGAPMAGAKAGGLVVALAAFGSYAWLRSGQRLSMQSIGLGAAGILVLLLSAVFGDAHFNGLYASHFGQAAVRLTSGGSGEWEDIIRRKLMVEGHLLWHSAWAIPLWGGIAAMCILRKRVNEADHALYLSGLVASVSCLAVNDAGTVAAALCLTLLWSRLFTPKQQKARSLLVQGAG